MTEPSEVRSIDREAFEDLLRNTELETVEAVQIEAVRRAHEFPDDVSVRIELQTPSVERQGNTAWLRYAHRATVIAGDSAEKAAIDEDFLGRVVATHQAVLSISDGALVDKDALQQFAEADAYFMAYPYVRQTLQQLAETVSLPPVVLPRHTWRISD